VKHGKKGSRWEVSKAVEGIASDFDLVNSSDIYKDFALRILAYLSAPHDIYTC